MADYNRISGSKEKIGINLSTTDGSAFVVSSATVNITGSIQLFNPTRVNHVSPVVNAECEVDNEATQPAHKIEYLWECKGPHGSYKAEFSAKLGDGQVVVRSVTISVD